MMALQEEIRGLKAMQSSDPRGGNSLIDFQKLNPSIFRGSTDPLEAESWLQEMEKALTHMGIGGETQVTFATYMLREGAYEWWKSVRDGHSDKTQSWTWKEFVRFSMTSTFQIVFIELRRQSSYTWNRVIARLSSTSSNLLG
uniref:Retrotransposon gag domain-containing protein n=1 Tax=Ananas comosus var. bracteatus TaxID=296719 RepID=A0A6V7Q8V5_ANACO|nr:unnamed protein product [Ananas comosus var. bracteatus]